MATTLSGQEVADAGLAGWTDLGDGLRTRVVTGDFTTGLALVAAIGAASEEAGHHPDVDLRYGRVDVRLVSHDSGGVTERDVALARTVSRLAADAGLTCDGAGLQRTEIALDTPDVAAARRWWAAFLAYEETPGSDDEVRDPADAQPPVWFQRSGAQEPRQRWHLDVWVEPGRLDERVAAAVAAGGRVVDRTQAPSFVVVEDPEGNRACLCTSRDRD
ncbi:VOC family protein [Cellulomonas iranensis]|uniref:Putative pterin-4-alpha-carbinolamine dehydratase n=1 Tax=Cellulomonas iranensis TaxID=76862 RepID=A0ABU0GGA2_9CELL|nr:VOC family protein [Cellulomonas iranensis]MDQ0424384.1 4a-hydroxytetrahydrobiopterin dehydratase [Cellulomonas iranensis]